MCSIAWTTSKVHSTVEHVEPHLLNHPQILSPLTSHTATHIPSYERTNLIDLPSHCLNIPLFVNPNNKIKCIQVFLLTNMFTTDSDPFSIHHKSYTKLSSVSSGLCLAQLWIQFLPREFSCHLYTQEHGECNIFSASLETQFIHHVYVTWSNSNQHVNINTMISEPTLIKRTTTLFQAFLPHPHQQ